MSKKYPENTFRPCFFCSMLSRVIKQQELSNNLVYTEVKCKRVANVITPRGKSIAFAADRRTVGRYSFI
jgi:hypothetical protein